MDFELHQLSQASTQRGSGNKKYNQSISVFLKDTFTWSHGDCRRYWTYVWPFCTWHRQNMYELNGKWVMDERAGGQPEYKQWLCDKVCGKFVKKIHHSFWVFFGPFQRRFDQKSPHDSRRQREGFIDFNPKHWVVLVTVVSVVSRITTCANCRSPTAWGLRAWRHV